MTPAERLERIEQGHIDDPEAGLAADLREALAALDTVLEPRAENHE